MNTIDVYSISKKFGAQTAVDDVSFEVRPGEIFGLLGPNGAGKTTSIRIILDIFKPDRGQVSVFGSPMNEEKKNRIGYLPEERGLYQEISLENCLTYLASLKGLDSATIHHRLDYYLDRFNLKEHSKKKVKELSKGMQQKAQLIVTLIHEPDLVIIDEPFSALDPVNTQMVKDLLREERDKGKTIVMCTHQMHQVEELCDRLVLINKGKVVLYGKLADIQRKYVGHAINIRTTQPLPEKINGVEILESNRNHGNYTLQLDENTNSQEILQQFLEKGIVLEKFEVATPTLDEIFIQVVTKEGDFHE